MINETASAFLIFGFLGILIFEVVFIILNILSDHKWRKEQKEKGLGK